MILQDWLASFENTQRSITPPAPERCREILQRLNIEKWCSIVTVGGTNGKGSTTYCLAAYALAMGKKVGRFISPHLLEYNERIAIDNVNVTDAEIIEAFTAIKAVQGELYLGYFDYAFLAAMYLFKKAEVDFLILEVGLGGRLDATNAVDNDCAIITTIAFDHMEILGNTREAIGFEKAGIFRQGRIALCGDLDVPESVRHYAKEVGADLIPRIIDFSEMPEPHFPRQNALTALTALQALEQKKLLAFDQAKFFAILHDLHIPGRMQVLQQYPKVTVDVAHNPQGVTYLLDMLGSNVTKGRRLVVFSALSEKDVCSIFRISNGFFDEWSLLQLNHPRAMSLEGMLECAKKELGEKPCVFSFLSMDELMRSLLQCLHRDDEIIIFGSFLIASLFLKWYNINKKSLEIV